MTDQATEAKRWRGFTHKELYLMLHDGPGAQASADPSRRWAEVAATLTDVGQDLSTALESSGSTWVGRAAGAAYDRLVPLAAWAQASATRAGEMRLAVENQGDYIAQARADMPAPEDLPSAQPDPTMPAPVQVAGLQTDAEAVEARQSAGEQRAFEVMAAYELNTSTNLTALSTFDEPAELIRSDELHSSRGEGIAAVTTTAFAGGGAQAPVEQPGRAPVSGQGVGVAGTAFVEAEPARRVPLGPGVMSGVARFEQVPFARPSTRSGDGSGNRGGGAGRRPVTPAATGAFGDFGNSSHTTSGSLAGAAAAGAPIGAPMGAGAAGGAGMPADKPAMRRFAPEALVSCKCFGDTD
ncbi:PPE domain-containing protein [Actinokineospora sp.]|uniref:PPE domain-containing protein n=1 Tax=Actinokineospora sp. TaxID=1872133 RepID=UPI0040378F4E